MYKKILSPNEKYIFENVFLIVVNMNNGTQKIVIMKIVMFIYIFHVWS